MTTTEMTRARGLPPIVPILNPLMYRLLRIGVPMGPNVLLTVRGRTTGKPRTFPIALMETGGRRYVFATFGEVNWVHNLRAAGRATVRRGRNEEPVVATELTPEEAVPVLKAAFRRYLASRAAPLLRRWYDLQADSPPEDYLREARRHAVFELRDETRKETR
ncbi:MAG TPA: nitroreductase family deazaflavin-dependent oxidoreductase [Candidatus Bathyarchaeia archaeon]|nr:nitroreductase family deazaflavin-dependent oxidoreductase [Candidatus Bathyarchaeia archaeon]